MYNGLGDRLSQYIDTPGTFETVNYTLDLNAGLTQVLSDGTDSYLYGLDRIGEYDGDNEQWLYHHTDALGSMRQLGNADQEIILAQSFDPYGNVLHSVTSGAESSYGYTGEWEDETGLQHLRARYYVPGMGRFISKDVWEGNALDPISYTAWVYAFDNPLRYTDPSGQIPEEKAAAANVIRENLYHNYDVLVVRDWGYAHELKIENNQAYQEALQANPQLSDCDWWEGAWSMLELTTTRNAIKDFAFAMGGPDSFRIQLGGVVLSQENIDSVGLGTAHRVWITNRPASFDEWPIVHEFAHAWDANHGWRLSEGLEDFTGGFTNSQVAQAGGSCTNTRDPGCNTAGYFYGGVPPVAADLNFTKKEDFAESVTAYIYPKEALSNLADKFSPNPVPQQFQWVDGNGNPTSDFRQTPRGIFVGVLFNLSR